MVKCRSLEATYCCACGLGYVQPISCEKDQDACARSLFVNDSRDRRCATSPRKETHTKNGGVCAHAGQWCRGPGALEARDVVGPRGTRASASGRRERAPLCLVLRFVVGPTTSRVGGVEVLCAEESTLSRVCCRRSRRSHLAHILGVWATIPTDPVVLGSV